MEVKMRLAPASVAEIHPVMKIAAPVCLQGCALTGRFVNGNE
jgi:hypothetical protein